MKLLGYTAKNIIRVESGRLKALSPLGYARVVSLTKLGRDQKMNRHRPRILSLGKTQDITFFRLLLTHYLYPPVSKLDGGAVDKGWSQILLLERIIYNIKMKEKVSTVTNESSLDGAVPNQLSVEGEVTNQPSDTVTIVPLSDDENCYPSDYFVRLITFLWMYSKLMHAFFMHAPRDEKYVYGRHT